MKKLELVRQEKFKIEELNWEKINIDNAKYILDEGKAYVKHQGDSSDKITNRAFAILAILLPITSALIVFGVNEKFKPVLGDKVILYLLFSSAVALIAVMFGLSKIVFPRKFMPLGREPRAMCTNEFLGIDYPLANLAIILSEIESTQTKVDYNDEQIEERTALLKRLMLSIGLLFLTAIIVLTLHIILG